MMISVVVPTYRNTKEEIERCLGSIYHSDWRDFEVLLVDDGNTAEYAAYLDTLPTRFAGLCVLHLPHGGVSAARNAAISEAQGEYILFSDADDIVTMQFWEDAKEISARGIEADIIYGMVVNRVGKTQFGKGGELLSLRDLDEEDKRELYAHFFALQRKQFFFKDTFINRGPVAKLVWRNFAKKFSFRADLTLGEDMIWNMDLLRESPNVGMVSHAWYQIMRNPESVTRGYRPEFVEWHRQLLQVLRDYVTPDTKKDYRQRIYESLGEIGRKYYLSPQNSLSWFQKVKEFNQMAWSEPFDTILEIKEEMGSKEFLKFVLYKMGLLLYAYKLKMLLGK